MANDNIPKNGQIKADIQEEKILWKDRKRTLFGLPLSFTTYKLTPTRLILQTGFLDNKEDEVRLYRIKDISYHQTLGEKIFGLGCVKLYSSDASLPELVLKRIKNSEKVKELLSQSVELARKEAGVHTSELLNGMVDGYGEAQDSDMSPDFNHDGADNRQQ